MQKLILERDEIDLEGTGKNIKFLLKEKGIKPCELADALRINEKSVYKWQEGKSLPSVDNLCAMCRPLETSIEGILKFKCHGVSDTIQPKTKKRYTKRIILSEKLEEFEKFFGL